MGQWESLETWPYIFGKLTDESKGIQNQCRMGELQTDGTIPSHHTINKLQMNKL